VIEARAARRDLRQPATLPRAVPQSPYPCGPGTPGVERRAGHGKVPGYDRGWHLVDAQVASAPAGTYTDAEIDPLGVPRDAFLVAGQAWQQCRTGGRDPDRIGTSAAGLTGMWEVQGNVIRDLANLNRVETLPWDEWGLIPIHQLDPADVNLIDAIAAISAAGGPLRQASDAYHSDPRIPAPATLAASRSDGGQQ
jgi:hypothetical protein